MFNKITRKIRDYARYHVTAYNNKDNLIRQKEYNRLLKSYNAYKEIKLQVGCNARVLKGWINIDLSFVPFEKSLIDYTDKYYPKNIRGDKNDFFAINIIKTGLPLPNDSVDLIFHEDFIEHLDQKEQIIFLAETLRVMKPGSVHRINTPNLLVSMKEHSDFKKGKPGIYVGEWDKWIHKNVLTPNYLNEIAKMVGYSKVLFNSRNNSTSKEIPLEYRPYSDRKEEGNIFADLIK